MKYKLIFTFLSLIFLINFSLAQLTISEPEEVYNLGDKLYVSLEGIRGSDEGNLNIDLVCNNQNYNLLRISARAFSKDRDQYYSIPYKTLTKEDLEINNLQEIVGTCKIIASINSLQAKTKEFKITEKLDLNVKLNKQKYNPGEEIILDIQANKMNNEPLNGFYETSNFYSTKGEIIQGISQLKINIVENQKFGNHKLNIKIYDLDKNSSILNQDNIQLEFYINQKPTKLEISISKNEINPEEQIRIYPSLLDQTNNNINNEILVTLESPTKESFSYNIQSNEFFEINTSSNSSAGIWKVYSAYENLLSKEANFEIKELPKLDYFFEGNTLIIKNNGNSPYNNILNLSIGGEIKKLDISLKQGEQKTYTLYAPDGEYDIAIDSNNGETIQSSAFLTGNAIDIKDENKVSWINLNFSFLWILLIILIVGLIFYFRYKISKGGSSIKKDSNKKMKSDSNEHFFNKIKKWFILTKPLKRENQQKKDNEGIIKLTPNSTAYIAKSSLVLNADKIMSTIISIHLKNLENLGESTLEQLNQIIKDSTDGKVAIDSKENFINLIFSPLITKTFNNDSLALSSSLKLLRLLNEFNKTHSNKIDFGIGVNNGDLVSLRKQNILEYTTIEDTISLAQKTSTLSKQDVLLTSKMRRKNLGEIKKEQRLTFQGKDFYKLEELKDKSKNQEKLKDLLNRV